MRATHIVGTAVIDVCKVFQSQQLVHCKGHRVAPFGYPKHASIDIEIVQRVFTVAASEYLGANL